MFSLLSGNLAGRFMLEEPLPWEMHRAIIDPLGTRKPRRIKPLGLFQARNDLSCFYRAVAVYDENSNEMVMPSGFSVVWKCPGPELGPVVVVANIRRKNERKWTQLTASLKESKTR